MCFYYLDNKDKYKTNNIKHTQYILLEEYVCTIHGENLDFIYSDQCTRIFEQDILCMFRVVCLVFVFLYIKKEAHSI